MLPDPAAPLAYLRTLLDEAFAGDAAPPHPARAYDQHRRQVAAAASAAQAAEHARLRAELDARHAAATTGTSRAAAAIRRPARPARPPLADCDWPEVTQPGAGRE